MINLLLFILIISIVIFVHELGHFIFAKRAGIYCYEFAVGMGPVIWQKQKGETKYSIRAIPLGGYVSMAGENLERDKEIPADRVFQAKSWGKRITTVVAGALFNFLLAFVLLLSIGLIFGASQTKPYIDVVQDDSPAEQAGVTPGSYILEINNKNVTYWDDVIFILQTAKPGADVTLKFRTQDGEIKDATITPIKKETDGIEYYIIGIAPSSNKTYGIFAALGYAINKFLATIKLVFNTFVGLITGVIGFNNISGPVGIFSIVGKQAEAGIISILGFISYISINLGFINLLPLPALDGGRFIFLLIEGVIGHPVDPKFENYVHFIGFVLFMLLFLLVTWNDIMRLLLK